MSTTYYALIRDNDHNDNKVHCFNLQCNNLAEAQVDLENYILDSYFSEDRDRHYDNHPNLDFYQESASVLVVDQVAVLDIDSLIQEEKHRHNLADEKRLQKKAKKTVTERAEYERLKAIFEPEKPKPKTVRDAYLTENSKCAVFCGHANECPSGPCQCYSDCYCKHYGSCKSGCVHGAGHMWDLEVTGNEDIGILKYSCTHCGSKKTVSK